MSVRAAYTFPRSPGYQNVGLGKYSYIIPRPFTVLTPTLPPPFELTTGLPSV
jgi:hypothetical protein